MYVRFHAALYTDRQLLSAEQYFVLPLLLLSSSGAWFEAQSSRWESASETNLLLLLLLLLLPDLGELFAIS